MFKLAEFKKFAKADLEIEMQAQVEAI